MYEDTGIHTQSHTHTQTHAYVHIYAHTHMHTHRHSGKRTLIDAFTLLDTRHKHAYKHAYTQIHIFIKNTQTLIHTYTFAFPCTLTHAYIHNSTHTHAKTHNNPTFPPHVPLSIPSPVHTYPRSNRFAVPRRIMPQTIRRYCQHPVVKINSDPRVRKCLCDTTNDTATYNCRQRLTVVGE